MLITVRAGGLLVRNLPDNRDGERAVLQLAEGAVVSEVLQHLGLPTDAPYLIILNEAAVPRDARATTTLRDGDCLTIMPPIKGGSSGGREPYSASKHAIYTYRYDKT